MPDIAEAAGVGRTTLHRYFADRDTLIQATTWDSIHALQLSIADAQTEHGSPLEAMRRMVAAMVAIGDRLLFLFGDPNVLERIAGAQMPTSDPVIDLIKRGQAEGVFDPEVSASWIQHVLWGARIPRLVTTTIPGGDDGSPLIPAGKPLRPVRGPRATARHDRMQVTECHRLDAGGITAERAAKMKAIPSLTSGDTADQREGPGKTPWDVPTVAST